MKFEDSDILTEDGEKELYIVRSLWDRFRKARPASPTLSYDAQRGRADVSEEGLSDFTKKQREQKLKAIGLGRRDEFKAYIDEGPILLQKEETSLSWWCQSAQRTKYPHLSLLAIEVLSIPAMSDKPECVFSGCRRRVPWDRTRTSSQTLESVECSKDWASSDILKNLI
jgi:hypothetical protein